MAHGDGSDCGAQKCSHLRVHEAVGQVEQSDHGLQAFRLFHHAGVELNDVGGSLDVGKVKVDAEEVGVDVVKLDGQGLALDKVLVLEALVEVLGVMGEDILLEGEALASCLESDAVLLLTAKTLVRQSWAGVCLYQRRQEQRSSFHRFGKLRHLAILGAMLNLGSEFTDLGDEGIRFVSVHGCW